MNNKSTKFVISFQKIKRKLKKNSFIDENVMYLDTNVCLNFFILYKSLLISIHYHLHFHQIPGGFVQSKSCRKI